MCRVRSSERHYQGGKDGVFGYEYELIVWRVQHDCCVGWKDAERCFDGLASTAVEDCYRCWNAFTLLALYRGMAGGRSEEGLIVARLFVDTLRMQ